MFAFLLRLPERWPHTLMAIVAAGWAGMALLSAPLFDRNYITNGSGVVVILSFVLAFILGSWIVQLATRKDRPRSPESYVQRDYRPLFVGVSALAVLGVTLRLFDYLVLRSTEVALTEIARRKIDVSSTADESTLGLIAAPMVAFCYFPVLVLALSNRKFPAAARFLAIGLALFPAFEAVIFKGGTSGVAYALLLFLCIYGLRPTRERTSRKLMTGRQKTLAATVMIGALVLSSMLYEARIKAMTGGTVGQYLLYVQLSGPNILAPSTLLQQLLELPVIGGVFIGVYWFCLYVTSGVYNLLYVLEVPAIHHTVGGTQLQVFIRAFDILTGNFSRPPIIDANPLAGLYQTMFGDVFIDFGAIGGTLQCFGMGLVAGLVHRARERGYLAGQVLDPIFKTFIMMGIFISSLSAFGLFILLAALGTLVLATVLPSRSVVPVDARAPQSSGRELR